MRPSAGFRPRAELLEDRVLLATTLIPTLVVPRLAGGSLPDPMDGNAFDLNRGFPASQLMIGPSYDDLMQRLTERGYDSDPASPNQNLFAAPYDWRMPAAPEQVTRDGEVTGLRAHWNDPADDDTFDYAVDYLRYWLIQAVEKTPGTTKVDVISHNTGGLLVRAYIQSDAYGQTVLDPEGREVTLPTIDKFVMSDAPTEGAPFVWNLWNGNLVSFYNRGFDSIFKPIGRAYDDVVAGGTISAPDPADDITLGTISSPNPMVQQTNFYRQYAALNRSLIPTYNFLYPLSRHAPVNVNNDPDSANTLLLDLNATSSPGVVPWAGLVDQLFVTYPVDVWQVSGGPVKTTVAARTRTGEGGMIWSMSELAEGTPRKTVPGETWYQEISRTNEGDGSFPVKSMQGMFFNASGNPAPNVDVQQWGNRPSHSHILENSWTQVGGDLTHNVFIKNPAIVSWISDEVLGSALPNHHGRCR